MQDIFENAVHLVRYDAAQKLVILRRSHIGLTAVDRDRLLSEIVSALRPLRNQRLLIDVRQAPGNNDPEIEKSIQEFRRHLDELFPITALVVATAVGRLQLIRLGRERGDAAASSNIFGDEAQAIAYLMSHAAD